MVDWEKLIQFMATQGPWAIAAVAIFYIYNRSQMKRETDDKGDKELLMKIVTDNTTAIVKNTAVCDANIASTNANTAATNELRGDLARLAQAVAVIAADRPSRRNER